MPGPRNAKAKKKAQTKKDKRAKPANQSPLPQPTPLQPISTPHLLNSQEERPLEDHLSPDSTLSPPVAPFDLPPSQTSSTQRTTSPDHIVSHAHPPDGLDNTHSSSDTLDTFDDEGDHSAPLPARPFIEDPGTGIRVRDIRAFLSSRFVSPPSLDDDLCAEFAQEEVLQMLCSVLPEETAAILWYNKSRLNARICPACQRLYRLGDVLLDPLGSIEPNQNPEVEARVTQARYREQQISGLCSPVCFILAAFNYPAAIRSTWGRMAEELSDETWDLIGDTPQGTSNDMGLGMLLKMTRCHDLGLGQLFFPDLDFGEEGTPDELGRDEEDQSDESVEGLAEVPSIVPHGWTQDHLKEVVEGVGNLEIRVAPDGFHEF